MKNEEALWKLKACVSLIKEEGRDWVDERDLPVLNAAIKALESSPRYAKWIQVHGYCTPGGDPVWACSNCGKGVHVYGIEASSYGRDIADGQWKACPNLSDVKSI